MATKTDIIKEIEQACTRVLKQSDFAGGVVTALTLVIARLTSLRGQIQSAGEIDPNISSEMWNELYECTKVLDTVYCGFPMVPAEDVATLATDSEGEDMGAEEMIGMCADTLAKAAEAKGLEAGPPVAVVKAAVAKWASLGETDPEGAKVKVLRIETLAKAAKACGDKKSDQKAAKELEEAKKAAAPASESTTVEAPAEDARIAKFAAIAKAADPAPAPAPDPAPARVAWPLDVNG